MDYAASTGDRSKLRRQATQAARETIANPLRELMPRSSLKPTTDRELFASIDTALIAAHAVRKLVQSMHTA